MGILILSGYTVQADLKRPADIHPLPLSAIDQLRRGDILETEGYQISNSERASLLTEKLNVELYEILIKPPRIEGADAVFYREDATNENGCGKYKLEEMSSAWQEHLKRSFDAVLKTLSHSSGNANGKVFIEGSADSKGNPNGTCDIADFVQPTPLSFGYISTIPGPIEVMSFSSINEPKNSDLPDLRALTIAVLLGMGERTVIIKGSVKKVDQPTPSERRVSFYVEVVR